MSFPTNSIKKLSEESKKGLSGKHIPLVQNVLIDLKQNIELFDSKNLKFETVPKVMDRIVLYQDENIIIRVHFFPEGASETYKHNHQNSFISTCLEGSYQHKLWIPVEDNVNKYFSTLRLTGGELGEPEQKKGEVKNILVHTFEKGQSLFISELGIHSVHGSRKTTTIIVKEINSKTETKILSFKKNIDAPTEKPEEITKKYKKKEMWKSFTNLITTFQLSTEEIETVLMTKVVKLELGLEHLSDVTNEILKQNEEILSILKGELFQTNEKKAKDFALILQLILLGSYYPHTQEKEFVWMLIKSIMTKFNMYCPDPVKDDPIKTLQNLMWVFEIHDLKPFLSEYLDYFRGDSKIIPKSLLVNDIVNPKDDFEKNKIKVENWVSKYYPSFNFKKLMNEKNKGQKKK
jgi:hypothetical protein